MASSQNGWPASPDRKALGIITVAIKGSKCKLAVAKEVAPILKAFVSEFHEKVEPLDAKQDDWGYAFRQVRGSIDMLSNHASGTAVDLNATKHPLGARGTFTPAQIKTINELCVKYGIRWGGNYRHRADEMHFEITESPKLVTERIKKLGLESNETR